MWFRVQGLAQPLPAKVGLYGRGSFKKAAERVKTQLRAQAKRANLLVDGDRPGIVVIREAIQQLQAEGWVVNTTVYAPWRRKKHPEWQQLFSEPGVRFKGISRSDKSEDVDRAIILDLLRLAKLPQNIHLALLTGDGDFVKTVRTVVSRGREMVLYVPPGAAELVPRYESAGARVFSLLGEREAEYGPKVRAILHARGNGAVETAEAWTYRAWDAGEVDELYDFLSPLGYCDDRRYLMHPIAKFFYAHRLGDVTVFPAQCGCTEAVQFLRKASATAPWAPYRNNLALILPRSSAPAPWEERRNYEEYGGARAQRIFEGGGPFMLEDSPEMVTQALTLMGYLDYQMNSDMGEALMTFLNMSSNKNNLRKLLNALPKPDDSMDSVLEKLRRAFLSHASPGEWELAPDDESVRQELFKKELLKSPNEPRHRVLAAMKNYARWFRLPEMRSYNGYVMRILERRPDTAPLIEFRT